MTSQRLLVVGAHSADFVWRSAGAIATHTAAGGEAKVVALSYGERGESGELWKEPGQTEEKVKQIRHEEASAAAGIVGADFEGFDLGDYPLRINDEAIDRLSALIRDYAPEIILTHPAKDPFNPDHPAAAAAVARARLLAAGAGVAAAFKTVPPSQLLAFEPHQPDLCEFVPTEFVDITAVFELKLAAMKEMKAQQYLQGYYAQRAEHRANHARKVSGQKEVRYAEAFQRLLPKVVKGL